MTLYLPDKWVWDFWLAQDGADYHILYLQAPRALKDETARHWHVSIGHAVSQDLINWQILPDALAPSAADTNAWDNYTTWTGSIIAHAGTWHLLYTGTNRAEQGLIQRIGLATSDDLIHWKKHPANPIIVTDPRWYETLDRTAWYEQAWRDPNVFQHKDQFHCYITARSRWGHKSGRGVIAHARSRDLVEWEVSGPVSEPGEFGHLEVPRLVGIEGRWYLFFSVGHKHYSERRRQRPDLKLLTGTHYLVADSPLGPFKLTTSEFLLGDKQGTYYSGGPVQDPNGEWVLLAVRTQTPKGHFVGEISDPFSLELAAHGRLRISG